MAPIRHLLHITGLRMQIKMDWRRDLSSLSAVHLLEQVNMQENSWEKTSRLILTCNNLLLKLWRWTCLVFRFQVPISADTANYQLFRTMLNSAQDGIKSVQCSHFQEISEIAPILDMILYSLRTLQLITLTPPISKWWRTQSLPNTV